MEEEEEHQRRGEDGAAEGAPSAAGKAHRAPKGRGKKGKGGSSGKGKARGKAKQMQRPATRWGGGGAASSSSKGRPFEFCGGSGSAQMSGLWESSEWEDLESGKGWGWGGHPQPKIKARRPPERVTQEDFVVEYYAGKKQGWVRYDQNFVNEVIRPAVEDDEGEVWSWLYLAEWDTTYDIYLFMNDEALWEGTQMNLDSGTERKVRAHWTLAAQSGTVGAGDQWGLY